MRVVVDPGVSDFFRAYRIRDWDGVFQALRYLPDRDLLACLNFLGPHREDVFTWIPNGAQGADRILAASRVVDDPSLPADSYQPWTAVEEFRFELRVAQLFEIPDDPTGLLPAVRQAARLSAADFAAAAASLGVSEAAVRAVATVESGGRTGFDEIGRPKILFEAHHFQRLTRGRFALTHPHLSQANSNGAKLYYGWDQWTRMYEAMMLDPVAAWSAASWGMFQVMGFNHNGYPSVEAFVAAMFESEGNQLRSFIAFVRDNRLVSYLQNRDWAGFARAYNGPGYAGNAYDTQMARAYAAAGGR